MSTRVISDRELVLELARRAGELAETVAALHVCLERLGVVDELAGGQHSRRVALAGPTTKVYRCRLGHEHGDVGAALDCNRVQANLERERVESCSCGRRVVAS